MEMNLQGWAFRDRWKNPRGITGDDVRRVTSNWREYAGNITQGRAKERIANEIENPVAALLDTGQSVFDLNLLRGFAQTQEKRSITTRPTGTIQAAHSFALSHLLFCAKCEARVLEHNDLKLRARIIGWNKKGELRYRHSESNKCSCQTNSIFASVVEDDFARLINALEVKPEAIELMAQLALHHRYNNDDGQDSQATIAERKHTALARHRRALKNNLVFHHTGI